MQHVDHVIYKFEIYSHSRLHSKYIAFAFSFAFEIYCKILHSHSQILHSKYCIRILVCIRIYCIRNILHSKYCIRILILAFAFEILHSHSRLHSRLHSHSRFNSKYCIRILVCIRNILHSKYWYILHLHSKYCIRNTVCWHSCLVYIAFKLLFVIYCIRNIGILLYIGIYCSRNIGIYCICIRNIAFEILFVFCVWFSMFVFCKRVSTSKTLDSNFLINLSEVEK
jgi:hypothetical protein